MQPAVGVEEHTHTDVEQEAELEADEASSKVKPRSRYPIYAPRDPFLLNDYENDDEDTCEHGVDGRVWCLIPAETRLDSAALPSGTHAHRQLVELTAFLRYLSRNSLAAAFVEDSDSDAEEAEEEAEAVADTSPPRAEEAAPAISSTMTDTDETRQHPAPAPEPGSYEQGAPSPDSDDPLVAFVNGCEMENHGSDQFNQCRHLASHLEELSQALPAAVKTALLRSCAASSSANRIRQDLQRAYRTRRDVASAWFPDVFHFLPAVARDAHVDGRFRLELRNCVDAYVMPLPVALSTGCFLSRQQKLWLVTGKFSPNLLNRYRGDRTPPIPVALGVSIPFVITPHASITGDVSIVNGDRPLSPQSIVARMNEFRAVNQIDLRKGHCVVDCRVQKLKQEHPPLFALFLLELSGRVYVLVYEGDSCYYVCAPGGFPPAAGIAVSPEGDDGKPCARFLGNLQILQTDREYVLEQALARLFELHYRNHADGPAPPTLHMLLRNGQKFDM